MQGHGLCTESSITKVRQQGHSQRHIREQSSFPDFQANIKDPTLPCFPSSPNPFSYALHYSMPAALPFFLQCRAVLYMPLKARPYVLSPFNPAWSGSLSEFVEHLSKLHPHRWHLLYPTFFKKFLCILLFPSQLEFGQLGLCLLEKSEFSINTCFVDEFKWLLLRLGKWVN